MHIFQNVNLIFNLFFSDLVDSSSSRVLQEEKGKRRMKTAASTNATKIKGWRWDLLFEAKLSTMLIRLVYYGLRAMEVRSIPVLSDGRATLRSIGDGCCSGVLVILSLSTTISRLSTTTKFARLLCGRGHDGDALSAPFKCL